MESTNMVAIPPVEVTMQDLFDWYEVQRQLATLKDREMSLRKKIFKGKFPTPKEGTNQVDLDAGYVLKGVYVINRGVDEAALTTLTPVFAEAGIKVPDLISRKPELVIKPYRALTDDQRKMFDQCLVIKEGTPSLEITMPKRKT